MRLPRSSGVLLHVTSLPGPHGSGDLGRAAYQFVDWLAAGHQTLWQVLPVGGLGTGFSPYEASSAFAGNALLIDLEDLARRGLLTDAELQPERRYDERRIDYDRVIRFRMERLQRAAKRFAEAASPSASTEYTEFCRRHASWLDDHALFACLSDQFNGRPWCEWDRPLAMRDATALETARQRHRARIEAIKFTQWTFFRQWDALRAYANRRGVKIVGDLPIYIASNSVDSWVHRDLFDLDADGRPTFVAGVPPDVFSATGQRWGNALYAWPAHEREGFAWWTARVRHNLELADIVRVDHFRGFVSYWAIPAADDTAVNGHWRAGAGEGLFQTLATTLGPLPLIAEDLSEVPSPEAFALRRAHDLPGMIVMQFAWGDMGDKRFLPHNHEPASVVYTGTHDNDTALGWYESAPEHERHHLRVYLATDGRAANWDLIRTAFSSVADAVIVPMKDVLDMGGEHRMNLPGTPDGNWRWRFQWNDVNSRHAARLAEMSRLYGRNATE